MINLIISKSPSANSKYIYKKIEEDIKNGEKSFLIVPEQYTLQTDINLMKNISFSTVMDAKVLSFSSLSRFILDRIGGLGQESLSKSGKIMILTNILRDLNDDLVLFKNNYLNADFVEDIESLISTIKDNDFDQEFFKTIDTDLSDEVLKLKFRELKLIYEAYRKEIDGKFIDSEDRLSQVSEKLCDAEFLRGANFYFDKFDYVSDIKMDFIWGLLKLGCKVNINLTLDMTYIKNPMAKDMEIYEMAIKFYHRINEMSPTKEIILDAPINKNEDINHLCINYEKYNRKAYGKEPKNINVLESTSTHSEVENIALIIQKLIHEEDLRYKDISLYISDQSEYENEIKKIFNRYDIPIFLNRTNKLSDNHVVKTYLSILRLLAFGFNEHDLKFFLRSNIYDFGENAEEKVIVFQNYIKNRNIKGSMFWDDRFFEMDRDFYDKFYKDDPRKEEKLASKSLEFEMVNQIRDELISLLEPLFKISKKKAKTSILVDEIYKMMSHPNFIAGINNYQTILKEENDLDSYEENTQVWDKLMAILEELHSLMGHRDNDIKGVYNIIKSVAEDIEIGIIPPSKDHVTISSFKSPRIADTRINFALGLNDTFFPSKSTGDFIMGKEEKEKLQAINLDLKIYEEDLEEKEKLNLYKIFEKSDKIYLSFALSDRSGAGINKSPVLNGILNIFPKLRINDLTSLKEADLIYSKDLSQKYTMDNLWKIRRGESIPGLDFTKTYKTYIENYESYDLLLKGLFHTNDKPSLHIGTAQKLYRKNHFNITEIETYSRCPYRYFINFGLRPAYEENYDVDARELGTLVHNSLEDISKILMDADLTSIDYDEFEDQIRENFEASIDNIMDKARKADPRNVFIVNNILKNTKANSKEIINQLKTGEFKVSDVEVDFGYGKDGDYPPVYVDEENYLRGRIDRIDQADDFIRIIDYKTGNKVFKLVNVLNGLDLQLLVYMMSADIKNDFIKPIGSFYMPLSDELVKLDQAYDKEVLSKIYQDKFKMNGLLIKLNEEVFKLIDKNYSDIKSIDVIDRKNTDILEKDEKILVDKFVRKLVSKYIKEIKFGNIKLNPIRYTDTMNECQYCDYKGICKFDESIDSDKYRDFDKTKKLEDLRSEEEGWWLISNILIANLWL